MANKEKRPKPPWLEVKKVALYLTPVAIERMARASAALDMPRYKIVDALIRYGQLPDLLNRVHRVHAKDMVEILEWRRLSDEAG